MAKASRGRPSKYSDELGQLICDLLIQGKSLVQICSLDSMPHRDSIYSWMKSNAVFADKYARARELQEETYFDLISDIAFDESRDKSGELELPNPTAVNRDRLKIDSLKWKLGRMNPGKYGDKIEHEHKGGVTLVHSIPRPAR